MENRPVRAAERGRGALDDRRLVPGNALSTPRATAAAAAAATAPRVASLRRRRSPARRIAVSSSAWNWTRLVGMVFTAPPSLSSWRAGVVRARPAVVRLSGGWRVAARLTSSYDQVVDDAELGAFPVVEAEDLGVPRRALREARAAPRRLRTRPRSRAPAAARASPGLVSRPGHVSRIRGARSARSPEATEAPILPLVPESTPAEPCLRERLGRQIRPQPSRFDGETRRTRPAHAVDTPRRRLRDRRRPENQFRVTRIGHYPSMEEAGRCVSEPDESPVRVAPCPVRGAARTSLELVAPTAPHPGRRRYDRDRQAGAQLGRRLTYVSRRKLLDGPPVAVRIREVDERPQG